MKASTFVTAAVEGSVDEAVLVRLLIQQDLEIGPIHGRKGKPSLRRRIAGFNAAAERYPWVVLVDLDQDYKCAPLLVSDWLPQTARRMCFRVAVRAIESWLIADSERLAQFLSVPSRKVPGSPESLENPKATMVALARASGDRSIVADMVPRPGGGRHVGPAYASRLIEFVSSRRGGWRPEIAAPRSESLRGCIDALRRLQIESVPPRRPRR